MKRYLEKAVVSIILVAVLFVSIVFQKVLQIGMEECMGLSETVSYFISLFVTLFILFFIVIEKDDKSSRTEKD